MKSLKLRPKTILAFLLVSIAPLIIIGLISISIASQALEKQAMNQLTAVRDFKKHQVEIYFNTLAEQLRVVKNDFGF